jgi:hypothetical protein
LARCSTNGSIWGWWKDHAVVVEMALRQQGFALSRFRIAQAFSQFVQGA